MARIFITGSADGLGRMVAQRLVAQGHAVVLHARNTTRVRDALRTVTGAETAIAGDLASLDAPLAACARFTGVTLQGPAGAGSVPTLQSGGSLADHL